MQASLIYSLRHCSAHLDECHVLSSVLLTNHCYQCSQCGRVSSFPAVNAASIGSFFSFLIVMQRSLETKMEGLKKNNHRLFFWTHDVLGYTVLKIDELKMNMSKKQKWVDRACCKYCTKDYYFGIYSCRKEPLRAACTCPAYAHIQNESMFMYQLKDIHE